MTSFKLQFQSDGHVTKRCVRYKELDENGEALEAIEATVGTLYIKKKALDGSPYPEHLTVTVEW